MKKGDKIAVSLWNCPQYIESYLAAYKLGAVGVNVNYRFVTSEIKYVLGNSEACAFIFDEDLSDRVSPLRGELKGVKHYIVVQGETSGDMHNYEDLINKYPKTEPKVGWKIAPEDECMLFYTGGTTGMPKGAEHTNASITAVEEYTVSGIVRSIFQVMGKSDKFKDVIDDMLESGKGSVRFIPSPVLSIIGSIIKMKSFQRFIASEFTLKQVHRIVPVVLNRPGLLSRLINLKVLIACPYMHATAWYSGAHICLPLRFTQINLKKKHMDGKEILETAQRRGPNLILSTGDKVFKKILEVPDLDKYDTSSVAVVASSGTFWSPEVKKEMHKFFPHAAFIDNVGSTEFANFMMSASFAGDDQLKFGTVVADEIKIVDDQGRDVKQGETGLILVKGGGIGIKYHKDTEKTEKTWLDDGWYKTGDYGWFDENGELNLIGRGSEVINSAGEKIWAEEVENVIRRYWKIDDVAVIGVPDPEWGESVLALVRLLEDEKGTEKEIIEHCKKHMASYKKPRFVEFVNELPIQVETGKTRRGVLREEYLEYIEQRPFLKFFSLED